VKEDRIYVEHISECLQWIERFVKEGRESFFHDRKTQSAVLRELQTLAEASQRLSPQLKAQYPQIFWQGIAGFRNVLVHDYLGINLDRIWEIVCNDVPALREVVESMQIRLSSGPDNSET
jgi:uncharacterized protein with HEPN domain